MKISGDMSTVQSNLDFAIKMTSVGELKTVAKLRKHYFRLFMQEEREELRSLLKEKIRLEKRKIQSVVEVETLESEEEYLEEQTTENRNSNIFSSEVELEENDANEGGNIFSSSFFLNSVRGLKNNGTKAEKVATEDNELDVEDSEEIFEEVHGIYIEDLEFEDNELDVEDSEEIFEEVHGIYIEDLEFEDTEEDIKDSELGSNEETIEEREDAPQLEYSEHGVFIEDLSFENEENKRVEVLYEQTSLVDSEEGDNGSQEEVDWENFFDSEETDDNEEVEDSEEESQEGIDWSGLFDSDDEDDEEVESTEEVNQDSDDIESSQDEVDCGDSFDSEESEENSESIEKSIVTENEDTEEDIFDSLFSELSKEEPQENIEPTQSAPNPTSGVKAVNQSEVIVVPTDIRDFIRSNPASSVSYVLQYYSKKDLDKALMLGRVYKKKGKLFI